MPSRQSTVPNLDLSSSTLQSNAKISSPLTPGAQSSDGPSPLTPRSPKSSSSSPLFKGATIRPVTQEPTSNPTSPTFPGSPAFSSTAEPPTPSVTAIPQYPPSPRGSPKSPPPKHARDHSRSFFANLKAPKSSHKAQRSDDSGNSAEDKPKSRGSSRDRTPQISAKQFESTPDLPSFIATAGQENNAEPADKNGQPPELKKVGTELDAGATLRKNKPRFANLLSRSRSIRVDESSMNRAANRRPSTTLMKLDEDTRREGPEPSRPATSRQERPARGTGNLAPRNHPIVVDRPSDFGGASIRKERSHGSMVASGSLSQVSGASAALFNNLKQSSTGAADRLGKAGKGFFGKITRSGSTNERELVTDDNYVCSVINLPLIEQARRTRIAKQLNDCRDKTEFWMPALPYRCIDYLNFKGCEEEGLYRVPGSGKEVKHWQKRFDSELDINLFDVPDLYDINTIGSMFKAWLRELPDELFPKETQTMIAEKCEGATTAPQMLKDELSKLPPYHYYLLFAITCHLNLLHSYVDQNKMDYRNLCICFQPCMKIDAFCFQFLVCDWKNCWQGCWTEKEYLQAEKEMDEKEKTAKDDKAQDKNKDKDQNKDQADSDPKQLQKLHEVSHVDERAISSSGSSQVEEEPQQPPRPVTSKGRKRKPKNIETGHARSVSQLPELGPPLSPIQI